MSPAHPIVRAHTAWPAPHPPASPCARSEHGAPLHAEHAHGFDIRCRDAEWTGLRPRVTLNGCFPPSWFPRYRYCNEHLLCPPHVFWTGWGPWERCTAQCGGGIQARRRTCENGPDCAGCNVVSNPHPQPAASSWETRVINTGCSANIRCSANPECCTHKRYFANTDALQRLGALTNWIFCKQELLSRHKMFCKPKMLWKLDAVNLVPIQVLDAVNHKSLWLMSMSGGNT